jgi:large subunit ribosomal protein L10e
MSRKPTNLYRFVIQQSNTLKEYVGSIQNSRINKLVMGNKNGFFPVKIDLIAINSCLIRDIALEAARITANRTLTKKTGDLDYNLTVGVYPHIVLRENKQATGAEADRVSQGMQASFGKNVGLTERVQNNQIIISVNIFEKYINFAKEVLKKASSKIPIPFLIKIAG